MYMLCYIAAVIGDFRAASRLVLFSAELHGHWRPFEGARLDISHGRGRDSVL